MKPLPKSRVTLALVLIVISLASVWVVRWIGKKKPAPQQTFPGNPPIPVEPETTPAGEFAPPAAGGVRRFAAPRGEEITGLSVSPDGALMAAVTAKNLYLFDAGLEPLAAVELPGLPPAGRQVVALGPENVSIWNTVPAAQTETRVLRVALNRGNEAPPADPAQRAANGWRVAQEERIAGEVAFGAAVAGHLVLVAREPATVAVFDAAGKLVAQHEIAANPQRIDVSADGKWAAVASAGDAGAGYAGVIAVDLRGATPVFTTVNTGPGVFRPSIALPLHDAVLVAGSAESDRPLAVVSPLAGGDLRARLPLGDGVVVGAARTASGERAALFLTQPKGEGQGDSEVRAIVVDTKTWSTQKQLAAGPARPGNRPVVLGERIVVAACHAAPVLDLAAGTVDPGQSFPSPGDGPCIDGLYLAGEHLAAREARRVLTWPAPR